MSNVDFCQKSNVMSNFKSLCGLLMFKNKCRMLLSNVCVNVKFRFRMLIFNCKCQFCLLEVKVEYLNDWCRISDVECQMMMSNIKYSNVYNYVECRISLLISNFDVDPDKK